MVVVSVLRLVRIMNCVIVVVVSMCWCIFCCLLICGKGLLGILMLRNLYSGF